MFWKAIAAILSLGSVPLMFLPMKPVKQVSTPIKKQRYCLNRHPRISGLGGRANHSYLRFSPQILKNSIYLH